MRYTAGAFEPSPHRTLTSNAGRQFDLDASAPRKIDWILGVLSAEPDRHGRKIVNYLIMG
jgi:hypothetical protein